MDAPKSDLICPLCAKKFRSCQGFFGHMRLHSESDQRGAFPLSKGDVAGRNQPVSVTGDQPVPSEDILDLCVLRAAETSLEISNGADRVTNIDLNKEDSSHFHFTMFNSSNKDLTFFFSSSSPPAILSSPGGSSGGGSRSGQNRKLGKMGAPKSDPICPLCAKKFCSWNAVYGHMRVHPKRDGRGDLPPSKGHVAGCPPIRNQPVPLTGDQPVPLDPSVLTAAETLVEMSKGAWRCESSRMLVSTKQS